MPRRSPETLADYLAVAICPFLIFLLVASLMFFLVEVFHEGEFKLRLQWVMLMFCMAIVCIARIAMEEGTSYATLYALPLGGAVAFVTWRLVPGGVVVSLPLMGLVWWAAHKLTWDCTLVDDTQDASGQGLLQEMGLDPQSATVPSGPAGTTTRVQPAEATSAQAAAEPEKQWWEKLLEPDRRPHAPGVWVIYFSLAALPLFGLGGWFVSQPEARVLVFRYLLIYVASGLGLLLATSFLGLRRYLRQRNLEMPAAMAGTWIAVGAVLIVGTLIFAAILPRFRSEHSLSHVPTLFASAVRQASRFGFGPDGTSDSSNPDAPKTEAQENQQSENAGGKQGEAKQGQSGKSKKSKGGKGKSDDKQGGGDSQGGQQGNSSNQPPENQGGQKSSGEKSDGDQGKSKDGGEQQGEKTLGNDPMGQQDSQAQQDPSASQQQQPPPEQPPPSRPQFNFNIGAALFTLIKWLFWLALLVAAAIAGWFYREQLTAAFEKLLKELREFWAWLLGHQPAAAEQVAEVERPAPPRPFAAFADPFANGDAARMPWPELIRYTFAAVEAWGRERACPRHADQTPHEFAQHLAELEPNIAAPMQSLAGWYAQLAYAPTSASAGKTEPLRQLWTSLRQAAAHAPVPAG